MDLRRLAEDHEARNESSYRPSHIRQTPNLPAIEALRFIESFWRLMRPEVNGRLETLDRHLIRSGLHHGYVGVRVTPHAPFDPNAYAAAIDAALVNLAISDPAHAIRDFIVGYGASPEPIVLAEAAGTDDPSHPRHHLQVLARAALMLRLSTGSARQLLSGCGLNADVGGVKAAALQFWWASYGATRGLWDHPLAVPITDLYADIEVWLEELRAWIDGNAAGNPPIRAWRTNAGQGAALRSIGACELIGLWGLIG
jgi:hypothetical protein